MASMRCVQSCDASADCLGCSGPHHGHYVAIVKGPHSWLIFDDDKIEAIKESEIPRYFGDAASGSAYVLYYQAVDLDPASLGIKVPALAPVPDITIAGSPAYATTANGLSHWNLRISYCRLAWESHLRPHQQLSQYRTPQYRLHRPPLPLSHRRLQAP
ncbi:hypothetical protein BJV77DRAFT_235096 [Russula vinacea]|nr:hypothetical protein BJV77DRAFT_235096 [Russula vinacea]